MGKIDNLNIDSILKEDLIGPIKVQLIYRIFFHGKKSVCSFIVKSGPYERVFSKLEDAVDNYNEYFS